MNKLISVLGWFYNKALQVQHPLPKVLNGRKQDMNLLPMSAFLEDSGHKSEA